MLLALPTRGLSLGALALSYAYLYCRIQRAERKWRSPADAELYARYVVMGKLPQALGQLAYRVDRLRGRRAALYEYKSEQP